MPPLLIIILVILVILFVIFAIAWFFYQTTGPANCGLQKRLLLPDKCMGGCPEGHRCINTGDRPYGPFGILGTQHAICNCAPDDWADSLN